MMSSTPLRTIPIEDFFKKPEKVLVKISPKGEYLAWMEPHDRRLASAMSLEHLLAETLFQSIYAHG